MPANWTVGRLAAIVRAWPKPYAPGMALRLIAVTAAVAALGAVLAAVVLAGQQRSVAWTGRDLGTLGGRHSSAWAINDRGLIVGVSATASRGRRFVLWEEGKPSVDLGPAPGGSRPAADPTE